MSKFDEPNGFGLGDEEGFQAPVSFDPLIDPWPTPEVPVAAGGQDDYLFGFEPVPVPAEDYTFTRYNPEVAAYPDRYQPAYQERLTELQRALREGTLTFPHAERRWAVTIRELAETLLLAALIFLAVRASFQNFRVEGASMQPSLEHGEYLIVNKLSYAEVDVGALDWLPFFDSGSDSTRHLWGEPTLGDVIVFRAPSDPDRDFIKRVIGTPGDTVEIEADTGTVRVNGNSLEESYIQGRTACGQSCTYVIPAEGTAEAQEACGSDECYFVMGDNRQNSSDSRQGWMVPRENIIGKALITYWHKGGPNIGLAPNHSAGFAEGSD